MNTMEMIMRGKRIEQVESNYISSVLGYLNVFGENINDCNLESNTVIKSFELAQGHLNMSDVQVYALYLKNFIINKHDISINSQIGSYVEISQKFDKYKKLLNACNDINEQDVGTVIAYVKLNGLTDFLREQYIDFKILDKVSKSRTSYSKEDSDRIFVLDNIIAYGNGNNNDNDNNKVFLKNLD